ncbi:protein of unknown function [Taphrina deformans PYCC 5710]|uniref:Uncharacterized protein n=1 Tax=Taphrina deformans (strain PYCC 5710 / ATCC 11124 / CBS 356.35 / IMI 108563 / JCM 9778 / NBRC 8474) TaxID=1097556 RepID=R4XLY9_TAPDE|nr:protein of unknown function [Taphrina deformans PYCC 5710]|eukprot:CCG84310.1 protein of unknown function [Taphrina deformans PYCC 5710]
MGASLSTPSFGNTNAPCTTTSSYNLPTTTSAYIKDAVKTSSRTSAIPTLTTSKPVQTSTTAAASTSTPVFYLKSSCDNSCLGHFAADDQIYSNLYSSTDSSFDSFYIQNGVLYDSSTSTLCVSSEGAGSDTRFQCSNDPDYVNGVALANVWSSASSLLTLNGNSVWYGCGTLNLADNYEPNGLTYSTLQGDPSNCRACTFSLITDIAQCNAGGQTAASSISTTYLPAASTVSVASSTTTTSAVTTSTTAKAQQIPTTTTSSTTSAAAAAVSTPKSCQEGYCKVSWFSQADCYVSDCGRCPWGTRCQQYQTWPWALSACLPPKTFWKA